MRSLKSCANLDCERKGTQPLIQKLGCPRLFQLAIGGLASAAAVMGNLKGHIFNAAGLHVESVKFANNIQIGGGPLTDAQIDANYNLANTVNLTHHYNVADILTNLQWAGGEKVIGALGMSNRMTTGPYDNDIDLQVTTSRLTQLFGNDAIKEDDNGTYYIDFQVLIDNFETVYTNDENMLDLITQIVEINWPDSIDQFFQMQDLISRLSDSLTQAGIQARADAAALGKMAEAHSHYIHGLLGEEIYGGYDE